MIFASVGTFVKGFDELILAVDDVCTEHGLQAFAQIGNSSVVPKYMGYARFLSANDMQHRIKDATLIICHGGFGILGDAMRAGKPIIAVPRQNFPNTADTPCNNQRIVAQRLEVIYGIKVCLDLHDLAEMINATLAHAIGLQDYNLRCNIPNLIAGFLSKPTPRQKNVRQM